MLYNIALQGAWTILTYLHDTYICNICLRNWQDNFFYFLHFFFEMCGINFIFLQQGAISSCFSYIWQTWFILQAPNLTFQFHRPWFFHINFFCAPPWRFERRLSFWLYFAALRIVIHHTNGNRRAGKVHCWYFLITMGKNIFENKVVFINTWVALKKVKRLSNLLLWFRMSFFHYQCL